MSRQLRQRTRVDYRLLNNGPRNQAAMTLRSPSKSPRSMPTRVLNGLASQLSYYLHGNLKFRVSNRIAQFRVEINSSLYSYLQGKYGFNSRFVQAGYTMLADLDLVHSRPCPHNPRNIVKIDLNYFLVRLHKKKDIVLENKTVSGPFYLYVKFGKLNEIL